MNKRRVIDTCTINDMLRPAITAPRLQEICKKYRPLCHHYRPALLRCRTGMTHFHWLTAGNEPHRVPACFFAGHAAVLQLLETVMVFDNLFME